MINSPTPLPLARPLLSHISHDLAVLSGIEELDELEPSKVDVILCERVAPEDDKAFDQDLETVDWHHRERCSFFEACHTRAEAEDWQGMSCTSCRAYTTRKFQPPRLPIASLGLAEFHARTVRTIRRRLLKMDRAAWPELVATAERVKGRHQVLRGSAVALAMLELGAKDAKVVIIGKATCPICREQNAERLKPVRRNGRCPRCGLYLEARGWMIVRGNAPLSGGRTSQRTDLIIDDSGKAWEAA